MDSLIPPLACLAFMAIVLWMSWKVLKFDDDGDPPTCS